MSDNFDAWVRLSEGFLRAHLHCRVEFCVQGLDARHGQPVIGHLRELRLIPRPDGSRDLTIGLCYESADEPIPNSLPE